MSQHCTKKRKVEQQDHFYFDSYADVSIHEEMIADSARTDAYRAAIARNRSRIAGRVVLDAGAGTGVLSVFCAQMGAARVYAVEASSIAEQAEKIARQNGVHERVHVIRSTLETAELPERVDVIVSEWMGYALLHESMLNSVVFVRDKWLKPGGLMLPDRAELFIAPVTDPVVEERLSFWSTVKSRYGVDMSCMGDFARTCIMNGDIAVNVVAVEDVLSHPVRFADLDLYRVTSEDLKSVRGAFRCECFGSASVHAFCVWFAVTFSVTVDGTGTGTCEEENDSINNKPVVLSTSPFHPETHWKQALLYLEVEVEVEQDTQVEGQVHMFPSERSSRHICIHLDYKIGDQKKKSRTFSIPDWSAEVQ